MIIFALDSSGASCAAAVWQDGRMLAHARENMERGQDARLMPVIVGVMAQAHCAFSDLDKIAVIRGPGSFTGLRVGLAAARGLGLAAAKPVIGIDRFAAYRALHADKELLVVIQSKRAELFCQYFPTTGAAHESVALTQDEIAGFVDAHPKLFVAGDADTPDDDIVLACAELAASADAQNPEFTPSPLYLRAPDVTFPQSAIALSGGSSLPDRA